MEKSECFIKFVMEMPENFKDKVKKDPALRKKLMDLI